jgi:hypothetical protein
MNLSDVMSTYTNEAIGSPKKYRLIIIMACRAPDIEIEHHEYNTNEVDAYNTMAPHELTLANPSQKLARRASFSAKQPAEVCPLGVGAPPMNLGSVKVAMEAILPSLGRYVGFESIFLDRLLTTFFVDAKLAYRPSYTMGQFVDCIDMSFYPFVILEDERVPPPEDVILFNHVLQTFQNMIRSYVRGAATNIPIPNDITFGTHIETLSLPPNALPMRRIMYPKKVQNAMLASMKSWLSPAKGGRTVGRRRRYANKKRMNKTRRRK